MPSVNENLSIFELEYTATEARLILQDLFPSRKLVLSQFTFYNQNGVGSPSGTRLVRGRRCYKLVDLLPIAIVLALKEQGIPNKNVSLVPSIIKEHSSLIFSIEGSCQISGIGEVVHLKLPNSSSKEIDPAIEYFLSGQSDEMFWSYDVGSLAKEISRITERLLLEGKFDSSNEQSDTIMEKVFYPIKLAV